VTDSMSSSVRMRSSGSPGWISRGAIERAARQKEVYGSQSGSAGQPDYFIDSRGGSPPARLPKQGIDARLSPGARKKVMGLSRTDAAAYCQFALESP